MLYSYFEKLRAINMEIKKIVSSHDAIPVSCTSWIMTAFQNTTVQAGGLTLTWYACLLGCFFPNFGIAIGGFSLQMKAPNLHKLDVLYANYHKKHPI